MDDRTREYLRGRFGDHYRRVGIELPPAANEREWGYIPFTSGEGTTMVRHKTHLDLGDLSGFLADERPRHVYYSAGRYRDPGNRTMSKKGWLGSDLVFDLDADHLPRVDPETDSYPDMLAVCKDALLRLLDFLETDFGFDDLTVVFSGGRGYHVHVRDESVRELDREERREVVDYVLGGGLDELEDLTRVETVSGMGVKNPVEKHTLQTAGWGGRVHRRIMAVTEEVRAMDEADGVASLREFDGIGEKGAERLYDTMTTGYDALAAGNLERGGQYTKTLARILFERAVAEESAPIDEPVTTDINRLIRLPGSLHGGTGLCVTPIDRDALDAFDPLVDAVTETFANQEILVETDREHRVVLAGETTKVPAGRSRVREAVGVFLMARGAATKARE